MTGRRRIDFDAVRAEFAGQGFVCELPAGLGSEAGNRHRVRSEQGELEEPAQRIRGEVAETGTEPPAA